MAALRPNFDNFTANLLKEIDLLGGGYFIALATEFDPDVLEDEDTYDYYGETEQATFKTINGGQLRIVVANSRLNQPLFDVLTDQKPDPSAAVVSYYPNVKAKIDVLRLFRNENQTGYRKVEIYSGWNALLPAAATGGPEARGTVPIEGRCDTPTTIEPPNGQYIAIIPDVAALTNGSGKLTNCTDNSGDATTSLDPKQIPNFSGYGSSEKYALTVEVQKRDNVTGRLLKCARITPKANTVNATGTVTITDADLKNTEFTNAAEATHAFIHYLWYGDTIPTAYKNGLLGGDGLPFKGRFD